MYEIVGVFMAFIKMLNVYVVTSLTNEYSEILYNPETYN